VSGGVHDFKGFCGELSARMRSRVLFVDYRLAPEHTLADSFADVRSCYESLGSAAGLEPSESARDAQVCVVADSAGGVLALKLLLEYQGDPHIKSAVLISPVLDLTFSGSSFVLEADNDDALVPGLVEQLMLSAVPVGTAPEDPSNSPLFALGPHTKLPPLQLIAGEHEIFRDDSVRAFARLSGQSWEDVEIKRAEAPLGVLEHENVSLDISAHGFHDYPLYFSHVTESSTALDNIAAFTTKQWND